MSTPWSELYAELEKHEEENPKEKVRRDPYDPDSKLISKAEKAYYKARMKNWENIEERREYKTYQVIVYKQRRKKGQSPRKTYNATAPYTFLQYNWAIYAWAREKYNLSQDDLDLVLYLYPIGFYSKEDVSLMLEAMGRSTKGIASKITQLKKKKIIKVWQKATKDEDGAHVPTLYCLTSPYKQMCSRMHNIALGEEPMPNSYNNPLFKGKTGKFYKLFERMNERLSEE